jgi:hypothetical protein
MNENLDPKALALTKAIGLQENGGKAPTPESYLTKGASGERGLYQFTKPTWQNYAGQVLGNPNADPTPENQNKVAYTKVKGWLDKGYKPEQVASMWNAGEGAPDAYLGKKGVNSFGAKYDVKAYADGVLKYHQQTLHQENKKEMETQPESFVSKVMDFAFPIIKDVKEINEGTSQKSKLQVLGDLGLSALWFVPGLGTGAAAGLKGMGILGNTGARVAGHALGGAAAGYLGDAASKLSEGETDLGSILTPGAGTATGGVLGGALGKLGSKYSQKGVVSELAGHNNGVFGQTKRGAQELAESFAEGRDLGDFAAKKGINLKSMINPETIGYETAEAANNIRQKDVKALSEAMRDALGNVPTRSKLSEFEKRIEEGINKITKDKTTARELKEVAYRELDQIRADYGEDILTADLHDLKQREWDLSRFDINSTRTQPQRQVHRIIGNAFKTGVEESAEKAGLKGVREMNDYIGQHLDLADALDRVHGSKAKGGRLGDLMRSKAFATMGGIGGWFGGGPLGSLMGALVGDYAGGKVSSIIRSIEGSPIKNAILRRMMKEDPEFVQKIIQYAQKSPEGAKVIKLLQDVGMSAPEGTRKLPSVSPLLKPGADRPGVIPGLITKTGVRLSNQGP